MVKSSIISCSRRTDIPAFLMKWVLENINNGFVDVINPFNRSQLSRISLSPQDVKCWVWWSKNFSEWITCYESNRHLFDAYKSHFFQFTINSPSDLEKGLKISLEDRFEQLKWLISKYGVLAISHRYDPIIFYKKKASNEIRNNLDQFEYIIETIASAGLKEITFSFATLYPKVKKRMISRGYIPFELSPKKKREITLKLVEICKKNNVLMKACCQPDLLRIKGIEQAHCIDAYKIEQIIGENILKIRDKGQRKECGCFKSKDIGGYSGMFRCQHNCAYCYASPSQR